jgi:glycosyltransferase involved in cell wall biosynthesis
VFLERQARMAGVGVDETKASKLCNTRSLRIAQLAPLYERIPPHLYGGTERVVSYLTEELVGRGHDVTLFGSGDSLTTAKLVCGSPQSLRLAGLSTSGPSLHLPMLADIYENAQHFDILHSHLDYWCFPFTRLTSTPTLVTMHGRLDLETPKSIYDRFRHVPLVSISEAQRKPLPQMNWLGTAYHGLPADLLEFNPNPGKYLAFLGRICPEKRVDIAIDVALRTGIPLKIAAKVDEVDQDYFETLIKPKLCPPDVELIGEISEGEKTEFLGNAIALLFTIDWPEPFGLAIIESLACGTPVITRPVGSVPEIVKDGRTGFIGESVEELVVAVKRVDGISRADCRAEFENRFTVTHMAERYEQLYGILLGEKSQIHPQRSAIFRESPTLIQVAND